MTTVLRSSGPSAGGWRESDPGLLLWLQALQSLKTTESPRHNNTSSEVLLVDVSRAAVNNRLIMLSRHV